MTFWNRSQSSLLWFPVYFYRLAEHKVTCSGQMRWRNNAAVILRHTQVLCQLFWTNMAQEVCKTLTFDPVRRGVWISLRLDVVKHPRKKGKKKELKCSLVFAVLEQNWCETHRYGRVCTADVLFFSHRDLRGAMRRDVFVNKSGMQSFPHNSHDQPSLRIAIN